MEIKFVEDSKNKIIFEIKDEGHTLANLLEKELWDDPDIKAAGYHVEHPLVVVPRFVVEVKRGADARKAVEKAVKRLVAKNKKFRTAFKAAK